MSLSPNCVLAIATVLKRNPSQQELKLLEQGLALQRRILAVRDPVVWASKTNDEQLQAAAEAGAKQLLEDARLKKRRLALTVLAHNRLENYLADMEQVGVDNIDALRRTLAVHSDYKGNFQSVESQTNAVQADLFRQMIGTLEATNPRFFGLFENTKGTTALIQELFHENSQVPEAKAGAAEYHKIAEIARKRFNSAGGNIAKLPDYDLPHHHSQHLVATAGQKTWVQDLINEQWLARDKLRQEDGTPMTDLEVTDFLKHAWETIATGGANKSSPTPHQGGGGMRANRGDSHRQIPFKDSASYIAYQRKYGERNLYAIITGSLTSIGKDIALVETFGPNPDVMFEHFLRKAETKQKLAAPAQLGKIDKQLTDTRQLYNQVAGKTQPVASSALANSFDTLKSWLVASRLGSAVVTSLADESTVYLTASINNIPALDVFNGELAAFNPLNRAERHRALSAGIGIRSLIADLNRFGQELVGSTASGRTAQFSRKLASSVIRLSGLQAMTEARRRGFGSAMMSMLGGLVQKTPTFGSLHPTDHFILTSKGIKESDWQAWKLAKLEDWGDGPTVLTAESIYGIPDATLQPLAAAEKTTVLALKQQAATKLLGAILEEVDQAVIEPGVLDRRLMGANLQRGTWKGELTGAFFLFKSFSLSLIRRHWQRSFAKQGFAGRAGYIAALIASTTVLGAAIQTIQDLLNGRDPRNFNPFKKHGVRNLFGALLKGGSLGFYGDFLFSQTTQHGTSLFAAMSGPALGLIDESLNLTQGNLVQAALGEKTDVGAEALRFGKGLLPGANLWYLKGILDHAIFQQLQEDVSPGYLRRTQSRAFKQFGTTNWWEPGHAVPKRAPHFANIIGAHN